MRKIIRSWLVAALLTLFVVLTIMGSAYAMATVPGHAYLPAVSGPPARITVVHIPIDFLPDSPFMATDGSGRTWVVVQGVEGKDHRKLAVVYRIEPDGTPIEMQREAAIYAQPKFAETPEGEVVYGADRDGNVQVELVEGWVP